MFICGSDLFWAEYFCQRFAFPMLFHFQCILITENFQLSSQMKTFSYAVISTMLLFHTLGHVKSILYVCSFKIYTLAGPVRRFFTHMWQNVYINIIRCGMKCDVYFPFLKVLFKKPKMNVFIFHLLAFSNICNLQQNWCIFV